MFLNSEAAKRNVGPLCSLVGLEIGPATLVTWHEAPP
jgi:hypothetical protein